MSLAPVFRMYVDFFDLDNIYFDPSILIEIYFKAYRRSKVSWLHVLWWSRSSSKGWMGQKREREKREDEGIMKFRLDFL